MFGSHRTNHFYVWLVIGSFAAGVAPGQDAIQLTEIFTNADGSVQYVELLTRDSFQTELGPTRILASDAEGVVEETFFDFDGSFDPIADILTPFLVATPGFEAAFGFAPDFVATGPLVSPSGRIVFVHETGCFGCCEDVEIDAVAYGAFTGDNTCFGSPAPFLPNDGCLSLTRVDSGDDNSQAWEVRPPSPRGSAGMTGSIDPGLCQPIPFLRGDVDGDGVLNTLLDALFILEYGFLGGPPPLCDKAADMNGDGVVGRLVDSLGLLNFGFIPGSPPPAIPYPKCEVEVAPTGLSCILYDCP